MRLSLPYAVSALATLILLSSVTPLASAEGSLFRADSLRSRRNIVPDHYLLAKRAGDDHDHDHDHPTTTAPTPSGVATAPPTSPTAPAHDDDHDHDHNHDHPHPQDPAKVEEGHEGHDHSHEGEEAEAGHSHGPARTCDPHGHDHGEYVVWHHIVALFVLMFVAALGCVIPMIIRDNARTRFVVQCGKYFGAGVVLSVAMIHIMPEALFALTHPCLSTAWTEDYPGYAPLIMMFSGLAMLVIEFLASSIAVNVNAQSKAAAVENVEAHGHAHDGAHDHHHHGESAEWNSESKNASGSVASPASSSLASIPASKDVDCNHAHGLTLLQCGPGVSTKISTYMLELGIALHSVFIGIALGVLAGSEFLAMTIAICFHQFFEGIALGSRIADLSFERRWVPAMLVMIFALVTPFGVAIGMGMRSSYQANSTENLIVMGVTDSIACGVLLYTAFVTLLGGDILYSERFRAETRASKASYLVSVWMGAITMAVLAVWA